MQFRHRYEMKVITQNNVWSNESDVIIKAYLPVHELLTPQQNHYCLITSNPFATMGKKAINKIKLIILTYLIQLHNLKNNN